jgi:hypothetical protein
MAVPSGSPAHHLRNLGNHGDGDLGRELLAEVEADGGVDARVSLRMEVLLVPVLEWEQSPSRSAATAGCYWFGFGR